MMNRISVKSSSCLKIKEKNSNNPNKSINMTWIMREKWESNSKINLSNSKINSAENKSTSLNCNLKSIICFIKIKMLLLIMNDLKLSSWECKNFMEEKFINYKLLSTWKQETFSKPHYSTILSLKNSKNKGKNMSNSWLFNLREK